MPRRVSVPVNASGIPDKPYFKIGEAARICGVKPYVLRYWETEFRSLRPQKTPSQQRLYRRKDVELLLQIRHLLYEKRFTIEGARARLREQGHDEAPAAAARPGSSTGRRCASSSRAWSSCSAWSRTERRDSTGRKSLNSTRFCNNKCLLLHIGAWRSLVSAPVWGTGGRWFKSSRPDKFRWEP